MVKTIRNESLSWNGWVEILRKYVPDDIKRNRLLNVITKEESEILVCENGDMIGIVEYGIKLIENSNFHGKTDVYFGSLDDHDLITEKFDSNGFFEVKYQLYQLTEKPLLIHTFKGDMKRKNYIFSSRDDWNKVYFCNIPEMIDKIKKMSLVELYGEDVLGEIN